MKKTLILTLTLAAALCVCTACSNQPDSTDSTTSPASQSMATPNAAQTSGGKIGEIKTTDLDGNAVTSEILKDYDLTLINIFTTWCNPCVEEMPYLAELSEEKKADGVQIIGVVDDVADSKTGKINEEKRALAKEIRKRTGVKYPILLPDDTLKAEISKGMAAYPKTIFVDKEGNIVGEFAMGSRSKDGWAKLIDERLAMAKE